MTGIMAMALNRTIGNGGKLPWNIPEEIKWFKEYTFGKRVVVGRKTYESFNKLFLKNRKLFVLSKKYNINPNSFFELYNDNSSNTLVNLFSNWKLILDAKSLDQKNFVVAGGLEIYKLYMPFIKEFYVSYILDDYQGDKKMFEFESNFSYSSIIYEGKDFWIVKYIKL